MRILLVEDDDILADAITQALRQAGYAVEHIKLGSDADHLMSSFNYDTLILDLGLPDLDGLEVLRRLRSQKSPIPVLILTARDTLDDRIAGLDLGADDYMTKPFKLPELEARVRALIRRRYFSSQLDLTFGALRFDVNGRRVYFKDAPLELAMRELDVLELLLMHQGQVISKKQFMEHLCGWDELITKNAIEAYISRLRKKLEPLGFYLRTVRGMGYLLEKTT